jgi:glutamate-ammonia-ligase adenylyltransferase
MPAPLARCYNTARMARVPHSVAFRDPARAQQNLARLRALLEDIPEKTLLLLLAQLPDPDGSLNSLERFASHAPAAVLQYLAAHRAGLHYLLAVFSYSAFLSETVLRDPELIVRLHGDASLFRVKSREELLAEFRAEEQQLPARLKRREYLRIMLRDVLELANLSEVTLELSALADSLVQLALEASQSELEATLGEAPSAFTVLSLGKLGGNELNYSSDIDLLYLYRSSGQMDNGLTHKEFFGRLAGRITERITASGAEGRVFRVDLRLRPEGRQGEAAHSLAQALDYYRTRAREWELQALVKARHTAGDAALAREFLQEVQPQVYRSGQEGIEAQAAALESVRHARRGMDQELRRRPSRALDVKLSPGGIRDIEFLVQCLQRLHGGEDPWLRSSSTLFALQKLADKGWLNRHDRATLSKAYHVLRIVEHRLQLDHDRQIHRLPETVAELDLVARRAGLSGAAGEAAQALLKELHHHMHEVKEIYSRVLRGARSAPRKAVDKPGFALETPFSVRESTDYPQLLHMLEERYPELYRTAEQTGERGRRNLERYLLAAAASPGGLTALEESPELIGRAAVLFEQSTFLSELLIHSPQDIEALRDLPPVAIPSPELPLQENPVQETPLDPVFEHVADSGVPLAEKMAVLRRHYRRTLLRVEARSILQAVPIFETLEATSHLAEQAIRAGLRCAAFGTAREGEPSSFTVVALGRLGVREFDLASDADLAFFYSPLSAEAEPDPEACAFWTRTAERLIQVLSSHTSEGLLFAVDTRLRPRGREGELVESSRFVEDYFRLRAEPWEAITYMKSRAIAGAVAGDVERGTELLTQVQDRIGARFGHGPLAAQELLDMRHRLEATANPHNFLKVGPGGYYDIDFVLTFLRLREANVFFSSLNSLERLDVVARMGQISPRQAVVLREGAIFLRALQHALRLESGRTENELPLEGPAAAACARLAERWFPESLRGRPLRVTVEEVMRGVREVFLQVFQG